MFSDKSDCEARLGAEWSIPQWYFHLLSAGWGEILFFPLLRAMRRKQQQLWLCRIDGVGPYSYVVDIGMGEAAQPAGSVCLSSGWGRWEWPLGPCPGSSWLAGSAGRTDNSGCIWDFMQLMGQPGAGEEPQNFVIFSTKESQSSSGLLCLILRFKTQTLQQSTFFGQENRILEVAKVTSMKRFLLMAFQVNCLLSFISFQHFSCVIPLHPWEELSSTSLRFSSCPN